MAIISLELIEGRPLLNVFLSAGGAQLQRIRDAQADLSHQAVTGLLDTGASTTCIDLMLVHLLRLTPDGDTRMLTPGTGPDGVERKFYTVSLILLGRDVLARCLLVYDGKHQSMTLAY